MNNQAAYVCEYYFSPCLCLKIEIISTTWFQLVTCAEPGQHSTKFDQLLVITVVEFSLQQNMFFENPSLDWISSFHRESEFVRTIPNSVNLRVFSTPTILMILKGIKAQFVLPYSWGIGVSGIADEPLLSG